MKPLRALAAALTLGALTLGTPLATPARAYVVLVTNQGGTYHWPSSTVGWTISTSVMGDVPFAALQAALKAAFDAWQNVDCATIQFTYGGQKANDPQTGVHFTFRENGWDPAVADALAYTVSEVDGAGTISSSDIVFNAYDASWSTAFPTPAAARDIQGVATHEIGHAIGLDHSRLFGATMFFSGGEASLRSLEPDDSHGACFLYPTTPFKGGQVCDACNTTSNCANGTCLDWGGGQAFCGQNCSAQVACPEGYACYQIDGVASPQCLPDNDGFCFDYGGKAARGDACWGNSVCASGTCLALGTEAYCSDRCNAANPNSCGAGWTCLAPGYCLKAGSAAYGDDCQANTDCATAECVFFQFDKGTCTRACGGGGGGATCPNGNRCFKDAACVPPGDGGVGTPCSTPDQCRGMYCESAVCTQVCGGGAPACPAGTSCSGGFCVGAELGVACTPTGLCPTGLKCFKPGSAGVGVCQKACDPFTDADCAAGEVCRWSWDQATQKILGQCVAENGGAAVHESCAERSCEANLLCHDVPTSGPTCVNDCRLAGAYGCTLAETCVSLGDAADPQRGACIPKEEPPLPDTAPDTSVADDPTTSAPETTPDTDPTDTASAELDPDTTGTTGTTDTDSLGADTGSVTTGRKSGCGAGEADTGLCVSVGVAAWLMGRRIRRHAT